MIAIGIAAAAAGLYFVLVGAGVLPIAGGADNLHGPLWILLCAGLAFFLAGAAVVLQGIGRANDQGEFSADAPSWLHVVQYLIGVAMLVCFGAIGSWTAFGPGERAFSGSLFFLPSDVGAAVGRTAFGIGAVIVWLCTFAFAVSGHLRLCGVRRTQVPGSPQERPALTDGTNKGRNRAAAFIRYSFELSQLFGHSNVGSSRRGPLCLGPFIASLRRGDVMMKSLTALATAGVIAAAVVAAPAPAQARNEGAIVGAAVGGLVVGGLIGSSWRPYPYEYGYGYGYAPRPVYYGGPYAYGGCHIVRQRIVTDYGPRWRRVQVCD